MRAHRSDIERSIGAQLAAAAAAIATRTRMSRLCAGRIDRRVRRRLLSSARGRPLAQAIRVPGVALPHELEPTQVRWLGPALRLRT